MKKIFFLIVLSFVFVSFGCSKKDFFEIKFDWFYFKLKTSQNFVLKNIQLESMHSKLIQDDILKTYTTTDKTGYVDSIVVLKRQTNKSLKDFVLENIEKVKVDGYKIERNIEGQIDCKWEKIDIYVLDSKQSSTIDSVFLSHAFFVKEKTLYIVSFATQKEEERKIFSSDVKNIYCK